jgi:hypothetical protein
MLLRPLAITLTLVILVLGSAAQGQPSTVRPPNLIWKTFSSRGGWKIKYPEGVHISSCRGTDIHDPDIFMSFFDVKTKVYATLISTDRHSSHN